jgi:heparosan-N-sulfate-glucuronate 5-epimerase
MRSNLEKGITKEILGKFADDDFTRRKVPHQEPLDEAGIPLRDPRKLRLSGPPVYHPVMIAQYALAQYNLALDGNSEAEEIFMRCARWLEDNAVEEPQQRFLVWPYGFPLRTVSVPAGWISGMAQGEGLSVLARSFQKTGSSRTAEVAERVAKSFLYRVEEGGVIFRFPNKTSFIEELAYPPFIHILNGCQVALLGLFEHLTVFSDLKLQGVLEACVQGIEDLRPQFDTGYWSLYSLGYRWNLAPRRYHHVHVRLFKDLGRLLNNTQFLNCADRWAKYETSVFKCLRHDTTQFLQVNARRALTILQLNSLKYRTRFLHALANGI